MAVFLQEIDGQKSKIGMTASVVANVEVAHFFEDEVGSGRTHDDGGEKGGHVDADGHVGDDLGEELALEGFDARLLAAGQLAKLRLEVGELALASRRFGIHIAIRREGEGREERPGGEARKRVSLEEGGRGRSARVLTYSQSQGENGSGIISLTHMES
jgi:hypothetical protein